MSEAYIRAAQVAGLHLLLRWDAGCRAQGLSYHLGGGTLLGAIRNGGFIHWDDDVDVAMPRADFEKVRDAFGPDCRFDDGRLTDGIGRLILTTSDSPLGPVRLDIFTIDPVPDRGQSLVWLCWLSRISAALGNRSALPDPARPKVLTAVTGLIARLVGPAHLVYAYDKLRRLAALRSSGRTANCLNGAKPVGKNRPTWWYDGQRQATFEGHRFPVPAHAEKVLALRYGPDFMTPSTKGSLRHVAEPLWVKAGEWEWRTP